MQINIISHHFELTPAINEYIDKKFRKIKYPDKINHLDINLHIENKAEKIAEITFHHLHKDIHIKTKSDNLYSAIDDLSDKVKRSFVKIKEQRHTHLS